MDLHPGIERIKRCSMGIVQAGRGGAYENNFVFKTLFGHSIVQNISSRDIIKENPGDILEIPVDCEGITIDIDTPPPNHLDTD